MIQRNLKSTKVGKRKASTSELVVLVIAKEKAKKEREDRLKKKNSLKAEWDKNRENILVMEDKLDLVKGKIQFVKGILKDYYINLMKQGTDTRYFFILINFVKRTWLNLDNTKIR